MYAPANAYIPQCASRTSSLKGPVLAWCVVAAGALLCLSLVVAAPLLLSNGHRFLALTVYQSFSHLCHQMPERSFHLAGHPLAVCARCTGLYLGFALGVCLYPLIRSLRRTETPARVWLFIAAAPAAIDFGLTFFGVWENTQFSRSATGALLGLVAAFYVVPGLIALSQTDWRLFARGSAGRERLPVTRPVSRGPIAPSDYSSPSRRI